MEQREKFGSRLGFILISAGCAIGLGNVWRFPYITGQYGGAAFLILYLIFLLVLAMPIMAMEYSVGRASRKSIAKSFDVLEKPKSKWHLFKFPAIAGNYLLMMFYTTVSGWMIAYLIKMAAGEFEGLDVAEVGALFDDHLADPVQQVGFMLLVVILGFLICSGGLKKGVEKITKFMMISLLVVMVVLVVRALTLPGMQAGLEFYLKPDFNKLLEHGVGNVLFAALGQAFFTLSIGMGSMAIFGSYIGKDRRLFGEAVNVTILDTSVAIMSGLIIFPACFAFGVNPGAGPGLIFVTLPNVFSEMPGGQIWGTLFFVFMAFAALSTIVAVFENILSFGMDLYGWSRRKAILVNLAAVALLSLPCALGFNLLAGFQPFGDGSTVLDLEDFIVSNNILPIGSLVYLLFCVTKFGWGWDDFLAEADTGKGIRFPYKLRYYFQWAAPFIIIFILVQGYIVFFS